MQGDELKPREAWEDLSFSMMSLEDCREWVLRRLHPDGAYCPDCNRIIPDERADVINRFWEGGRVCCNYCRKYFTALTNTVLHKSKLVDFRAVYLFLVLIDRKVECNEIARIIGIHQDTVRKWQRKLSAE